MSNVLIISQTNIFSGAEVVLKDYLLKNNAHDFFIYTNAASEIVNEYDNVISFQRIYSSKTMRTFELRKRPYFLLIYMIYIILNLFTIYHIVKKHKIEVLYGNNSYDLILVVLYKKIINKKIKIITHIHDMLTDKNIPGLFLKKFGGDINEIIVPSRATKNAIQRLVLNEKKIKVVYNGMPVVIKNQVSIIKAIKAKYGIPEDKVVLAFLGSIDTRKRPDLFLKIIENLKDINSNFYCLMAGKTVDLNLLNHIKKTIDEKRLPVRFLGQLERKEIMKIYEAIDVLVLTSDRDPLPTVILEAMIYGKIVFARDVDGVKEMIENNISGFTFSYNEQEKEIAMHLNQVLLNEIKCIDNIKANAIMTVHKKFSMEKKKEKINKCIDYVINKP